MGIENPTAGRDALHDTTRQGKGFGYLSALLGNDSLVSLIFGVSDSRFQIPDVPGQTPGYTLAATPPADSATLDANQRERNRYAVLSYQGSLGSTADYQVAVFTRTSDVHYRPDPVGDLQFNGIAADIVRRNRASGVQADLSWRAAPRRTRCAAVCSCSARTSRCRQRAQRSSRPTPTATRPATSRFRSRTTRSMKGHLWGVYAQDEWQATRALTFNYGLRYDQVQTAVDESQLSPRLGLVYDVTPTVRAARRLCALLHAAADREDRHHLGAEIPGHDQRAAVRRQHRRARRERPTTTTPGCRGS